VTYSAVLSSSNDNSDLWSQPASFYVAVALPCAIGLAVATWMASYFRLEKPERVAVAVECCYQNTGIATSVALSIFDGDDLAIAVGVPLFYGICEAILLGIYCILCWKIGWTKAPADENICVVLATSYEIKEMEYHDPNSIEVVLGMPKEGGLPQDLIFSTTQHGLEIDEHSLNSVTEDDETRRKESEDFSIEEMGHDSMMGGNEDEGHSMSPLKSPIPSADDEDEAPIPAAGKCID
jgi:hypothetical protein